MQHRIHPHGFVFLNDLCRLFSSIRCVPSKLPLILILLIVSNVSVGGESRVFHGMYNSASEAKAACIQHVWGNVTPDPSIVNNICSTNTGFLGSSYRIPGLSAVYGLQVDETGNWMHVGNTWIKDERTPHVWAYLGEFCQEPAVPNPNATSASNACMVPCHGELFDAQIRACPPVDAAAQSEECVTCNPINFSTGDKYLVETDYTGSGAFPLNITRYYHSQNGQSFNGRAEWKPRPSVPPNMLPPVVIYYEPSVPFSLQRKFSARTNVTADSELAGLIPEASKYYGNVGTKWGHTYDRFLLASFGYLTQNHSENPPVIRLYRPNGKMEFYLYSGGSYVPYNGFTSTISRLPVGHALAPGWHVVNQEGEIEIYDMDGKLQRITNRAGLSHHLEYDAATGSRLVRVVDDFGQNLEFEYGNPSSPYTPDRPTLIRDPEGNEYLYTYSGNGLIARVTFPDLTPGSTSDNPFKVYHYEDSNFPDALTGITDENGERHTTYGYDAGGRATFSELANGAERADVAYDFVSRTRTLTNALGRQTTYALNNSGWVLNVAGSPGASGQVDAANRTNVYNSAGFITRTTDWRGSITNFVRDARGLETSRTEAFGTASQRTINTSWHPTLRVPVQIVEPGRVTTLTYSSLGQLLTLTETDTTIRSVPYSTNGQSRTTTFTYHPPGSNGAFQVSSVDGPRTDVNDVTTYQYTPQGFLSQVTNGLGHATTITAHTARGLPLTIVDANSVTTTLTYHPRGWLLSSTVKHPTLVGLDAVTSYQYDAAGQVTRITMPNGAYLAYDYDAAHRLVGIANNAGESITYVLDDSGNVTQEQTRNAGAQITQLQSRIFDELGRIYQDVGGASQVTRFDYDTNGNLLQTVADPAGINQLTSQAFDGLNRLIAMNDAMNGVSEYEYDRRDNLTSVTDQRGLTTFYEYDGFDNVLMLDSPDTGITVYTYDKAGNMTSQVDSRGVTKQLNYDALNRVTLEHYPQSPDEDITYHYDQPAGGYGVGRLTGIEDQTGTTNYVYDNRGNQVAVTTVIQNSTYTTAFEYDLADNLVRTVYPSGRIVDHQLDNLGRVRDVTTRPDVSAASADVVSNIDYLPFGPVAAMDYGNDLQSDLTYDQDYRLTHIATVDASGNNGPDVLDLDYAFNAVNNIEDIDDSVHPERSQAFLYDLLNRLTAASGSYGALLYEYDAVGNRTLQTRIEGAVQSAEIYTYFPDSNSISSREEAGNFRFYQYDATGNVRSDGAALYFYDYQNRLVEVAE